MAGTIFNDLMLKVGKVNIAAMGFRAKEESTKSNRSFTASNSSGDVFDCSANKDPNLDSEDRTFTVYCIGACSLMRAFELKKRLDDELNSAILNSGHMQFERKLADYHARWEMLGGTTAEKDIVSQYGLGNQGRRIVILDMTVTLRKSIAPFSLSFAPQPLRNGDAGLDADWLDDEDDGIAIRAHLVTTGTSVPDEIDTAITLSDFSALNEYTSSTYEAALLTDRDIVTWQPPFGPAVKGYTCSDIRFPTLANDDMDGLIEGLVIAREDNDLVLGYVDKTAWTHIVNFPKVEDGAFEADNNTVIFRPNADGLFTIRVVEP